MKIKNLLIEYIRIMLYLIIISLLMIAGFVPGLFGFSLIFCIIYLIFIIPLIWLVLFYGLPKLEDIFIRLKNG